MTTLLSVKDLSIHLPIKSKYFPVIEQISFTLKKGKTLALLGESGCGKSITALSLMRLLPNFARLGKESQIIFDGIELLALPEYQMQKHRGRSMGMIFQDPMSALNPVLTIEQQLKEAYLKAPSLTAPTLMQSMLEGLEQVELPNARAKLKHYPHQLSGGQKQRVMIAMAMASKPKLLIADEPTTALDVSTQSQILQLLKQLQKTTELSILIISHDLEVVKMMADDVIVMYAGQMVEQACAKAFFEHPIHPYSQQLFGALPQYQNKNTPLQAIDGIVPSITAYDEACRFKARCKLSEPRCSAPQLLRHIAPQRSIRCHLEAPCIKNTNPESVGVNGQSTEEKVVSVRNLSVIYPGKVRWFGRSEQAYKAVDGVSFDIFTGQTLALVGASGCGKSTLARALMQLIPINKGAIEYYNQPIITSDTRKRLSMASQVQLIFQNPYDAMNPRMTVEEILSEGLNAMGCKYYEGDVQSYLCQLLSQVGMPNDCLHKYPHQFSGGQRQRLCIARALALKPKLLICDEPTSALDISVQAQILNLLRELQQTLGLSYLFISHDLNVVSYLADNILVMRAGKIVEAKQNQV